MSGRVFTIFTNMSEAGARRPKSLFLYCLAWKPGITLVFEAFQAPNLCFSNVLLGNMAINDFLMFPGSMSWFSIVWPANVEFIFF